MSPDPIEALKPLLDRLGSFLQARPELNRFVAEVARGVANWSDALVPTPAGDAPTVEDVPLRPPVEMTAAPTPPPVDLSQLDVDNVFRPAPSVPTAQSFRGASEIVPQQLPLLARRCHAKAEACRLVAASPTSIDRAATSELIEKAKLLPECFLWMFDPGGDYSDRPKVWEDLAGAFDTAAAIAEMLAVWDTLPEADYQRTARDVLYFAAEAQAVLYTAVSDTGRHGRDRDQLELYISIKDRTKRAGVFVERYMTINDPADASRWSDLLRRVTEFSGNFRGSEERVRVRKKALDRLRHKTRRLRDEPTAAAEEWPRVIELLDELVLGGFAPSNTEVRDLLFPVVEQLPDDVPLTAATAQVFREIDRFLASRPEEQVERPELLSEEVAEVRRHLNGRVIVLIGGLVRPDRRAALIRAFELQDLVWIATDDHESVSIFEAPIARSEVAVVLLAIRWSSHSYGDVHAFCERDHKLLVRLPGGYHPNQVAHQILTQVGERLRSSVATD